MGIIVTFVSASTSGYYLKSVGNYSEGNTENISTYPIITLTNTSASTDAQIAVSISKKGFFGNFVFEDRIQKWMKNVSNYHFIYSSSSKGTYKPTIVFKMVLQKLNIILMKGTWLELINLKILNLLMNICKN